MTFTITNATSNEKNATLTGDLPTTSTAAASSLEATTWRMRMSQRCLRKCQQRQERRAKGISTTKWLTLLVFLFALALLAPWRAARWGERKDVLLSEDIIDALAQHDLRWERVSRADVALSLRDLWYTYCTAIRFQYCAIRLCI